MFPASSGCSKTRRERLQDGSPRGLPPGAVRADETGLGPQPRHQAHLQPGQGQTRYPKGQHARPITDPINSVNGLIHIHQVISEASRIC